MLSFYFLQAPLRWVREPAELLVSGRERHVAARRPGDVHDVPGRVQLRARVWQGQRQHHRVRVRRHRR